MNQINDLQHNNKLKTIVLSEENYDKLKRLGSFGESFNDVLSRLLEMETGQNTKHWSEK
jgi:predicted CopG family antitoxin